MPVKTKWSGSQIVQLEVNKDDSPIKGWEFIL